MKEKGRENSRQTNKSKELLILVETFPLTTNAYSTYKNNYQQSKSYTDMPNLPKYIRVVLRKKNERVSEGIPFPYRKYISRQSKSSTNRPNLPNNPRRGLIKRKEVME